jgi:non-specific serine/threonine protein kinase
VLVEDSVRLFRDIGDKYGLAVALGILGTVVAAQGDPSRAAVMYEESLALRTALGDTWGMANALCRLATVVYDRGDAGRATALYEESLALRTVLGDKHGMAECYEGLAAVAVAQHHLDRAARLCGAAETLRAMTGAALAPRERARVDRTVSAARAGLGDAGFLAAWTAGPVMVLETALGPASASHGADRQSTEAEGHASDQPHSPQAP